MAKEKVFRVLVATDGSRDARAAVTATLSWRTYVLTSVGPRPMNSRSNATIALLIYASSCPFVRFCMEVSARGARRLWVG